MADIYRVEISPRANGDIGEIHEYIAQDSPKAATTYVAKIIDMIDSLNRLPARYHQAGRSRETGAAVHATIVHSYIIYYEINESSKLVTVMTVRHGRRRPLRRFP
jgi:plasmid stabilization system protein ParE